jgi:hypothetical protein
MSASNAQSLLSTADWQVGLSYSERSTSLQCDPNIDDPVNDTGLGPRRGDLQFSDEFACLVRVICEGSGEHS